MVAGVKRYLAMWAAAAWCLGVLAAEKNFDFSEAGQGRMPPGWKPVLVGQGKPGDWRLVFDDVPPLIKPNTPQAENVTRREVVAQVSTDPSDERFPLLVYEGDRYADFTARVRVKVVSGFAEQMAGLVFRMVDEKNFYVVRASGSGNVRFYKFVNGQRGAPIGNDVPVRRGEWHDLVISCKGNQIDVQFDGKTAIPTLTDNSHLAGRVGLFTKSDSISYFSDLRMEYRPIESLAEVLLKTTLANHSRLVDLQVFGRRPGSKDLVLLASKVAGKAGDAAGETEGKAFSENRAYYSKNEKTAVLTHPLHDRNGEPIGVARFTLKAYKGQLEAATVGRVLPMVKEMEQHIGAANELAE